MVGVRRAVVAVLAVGLVAAGISGWWLFSTASGDGAAADAPVCAESAGVRTATPQDAMLICRYDAVGALQGSALLTAGDSGSAERALVDGPEGDPGCTPESTTPPTARLLWGGHEALLSLDRACATYVLDGQRPRLVTPEVRAWAQVEPPE